MVKRSSLIILHLLILFPLILSELSCSLPHVHCVGPFETYLTIRSAIMTGVKGPGDIVLIKSGVYYESSITILTAGNSTHEIIVRPYDLDTVYMNGDGSVVMFWWVINHGWWRIHQGNGRLIFNSTGGSGITYIRTQATSYIGPLEMVFGEGHNQYQGITFWGAGDVDGIVIDGVIFDKVDDSSCEPFVKYLYSGAVAYPKGVIYGDYGKLIVKNCHFKNIRNNAAVYIDANNDQMNVWATIEKNYFDESRGVGTAYMSHIKVQNNIFKSQIESNSLLQSVSFSRINVDGVVQNNLFLCPENTFHTFWNYSQIYVLEDFYYLADEIYIVNNIFQGKCGFYKYLVEFIGGCNACGAANNVHITDNIIDEEEYVSLWWADERYDTANFNIQSNSVGIEVDFYGNTEPTSQKPVPFYRTTEEFLTTRFSYSPIYDYDGMYRGLAGDFHSGPFMYRSSCMGNWDAAKSCLECENLWINLDDDCGTCPVFIKGASCDTCYNDNYISDCSECTNGFDFESYCTVCRGNWDFSTDCSTCLRSYQDFGDDCGTCGPYVNLTNDCSGCLYSRMNETDYCNSCNGEWDFGELCQSCLGNRNESTDCQSCKNHWYDPQNDCLFCPPNYESTTCSVCEVNWDINYNCEKCLYEKMNETDYCNSCIGKWNHSDNCQSCLGHRNESTDCQTCENHWYDTQNDCNSCPQHYVQTECAICEGNWDINSNCDECLGNWDKLNDCNTCKNYYENEGDNCKTCNSQFNSSDDCNSCAVKNYNLTSGCLICEGKWNFTDNCQTCLGNRDKSTGCSTCKNFWEGLENDCDFCPNQLKQPECKFCDGNWDPLKNCTACKNYYEDFADDCGTCSDVYNSLDDCNSCKELNYNPTTACIVCDGNWDLATNCTKCKNLYQDFGDDCGTCDKFINPDNECSACLYPKMDESDYCNSCIGKWNHSDNCQSCLGHRNESTDCQTCENHWYDLQNDCSTCPLHYALPQCAICEQNYDISQDCSDCLGNWDSLNNCLTCKNKWVNTNNDCNTCPDNVITEQDCSICMNRYFGENCMQCLPNFDSSCSRCLGNWDIDRDCMFCKDYWEDNNNDCMTCSYEFDLDSNCTEFYCDKCVYGECVNYKVCECQKGYKGDACDEESQVMELILYISIPVAATILIIIVTVICCVVICYLVKKGRKKKNYKALALNGKEGGVKPLPDFQINQKLFRIKIKDIKLLSEIAKGGQGVVFLANWKNKKVVFKRISAYDILQTEKYEEFEKELSIASSLSHPNILQFFGACFDSPHFGIVSEFCSENDIEIHFSKHLIQKKEQIDFKIKIKILKGIIDGLEYLHSGEIIHRDMKSKNILLDKDLVPKIADFGLSKCVEKLTQMTKMTGTATTMAPEVVLGLQYNYQVDIFAIGIIMFEMLTSNFIPYGKETYGVEFKVANGLRPKLNESKYSDDKKWYIDLMKLCWQHKPEDRPTSKKLQEMMKHH